MRISVVVFVVMALLGVFMWVVDYVTLEGEWTIYTAQCVGGTWVKENCTGKLQAAERHRFRALKTKREVVFWDVGSTQPSGKLAPCVVQNRGDWICTPGGDSPRSITIEMRHGQALPQPDGIIIHPLPKWKWLLLRYGIA